MTSVNMLIWVSLQMCSHIHKRTLDGQGLEKITEEYISKKTPSDTIFSPDQGRFKKVRVTPMKKSSKDTPTISGHVIML